MCGSLFLKLPFDCLVPWSCLFASQMSVSMSNPLASRTVCSARDVTELRAVTSFNKLHGSSEEVWPGKGSDAILRC